LLLLSEIEPKKINEFLEPMARGVETELAVRGRNAEESELA
jgi:hypothetical protein